MFHDPKYAVPVSMMMNTIHKYMIACRSFISSNIRGMFLLVWMFIWLYLSLGAVVTSFVAIQLQTQWSKAEKSPVNPRLWRRLEDYDQNKNDLERLKVQSSNALNKDQKQEDQNTENLKKKEKVDEFENSEAYDRYFEIKAYKYLAESIAPWKPSTDFPVLPHPALILIVTLSMGALGGVLFMLQLHLAEKGSLPFYKQSVSYHLFRPFQGMAAALAIYLLVKAGQLSISPNGGVAGNIDGDLNVFVLGILGVISGLVSDRAIERISAAGIALLRTQSMEGHSTGGESKVATEKSVSPSDATQDPNINRPTDRPSNSKVSADKSVTPSDAGKDPNINSPTDKPQILAEQPLATLPDVKFSPKWAINILPIIKKKRAKKPEQLAKVLGIDLTTLNSWLNCSLAVPVEGQFAIASWLGEGVANLFVDHPPRLEQRAYNGASNGFIRE